MHLFIVGDLILFAAGNIADLLKAKIDRVGHPHVYRVTQDCVQRLRHIEISYATAGDPGRAGARTGFVEKHNIASASLPSRLELQRQMVSGAQAVDTCADDYVGRRSWQ